MAIKINKIAIKLSTFDGKIYIQFKVKWFVNILKIVFFFYVGYYSFNYSV